MSTYSVDLTEHDDQIVGTLINSGQFSDAGEVMRAGLRLLQQQARDDERKLAALRGLAAEGFGQLDRGQGTQIDSAEQLAEFIGHIGRRAAGGT